MGLRGACLVAIAGLVLVPSCKSWQADPKPESDVLGLEIEEMSPLEGLEFFHELCADPEFAVHAAELAATRLETYWDEGGGKPQLARITLEKRAIQLSKEEIEITAREGAKMHAEERRLHPNVKSYLKSRKIDESGLKEADFAVAWLSLAILLTGDETLATAGVSSRLGLAGLTQQTKDLLKLAKIGRKIHTGNGRMIPTLLDGETWHLINRNRELLNFGIKVAQRVRPDHPKVQRYSRIIARLITVSDFVTGFEQRFLETREHLSSPK